MKTPFDLAEHARGDRERISATTKPADESIRCRLSDIALDATGAPARMGTNGSNFKSIGAWWNATASKAQALRIEVR